MAWPAAPPAALALGAALVSLVACGAWRRFALRRQVMDLPDERRLHTVPTPRGGGVGIALALLLASPWLGQGGALFALGLLISAGGGLWDDLRPLRALPKLGLQALGALPLALAWPLLPGVLGEATGVFAAWLLTVSLVNIWNFMDGSNGLAASQALLVGAGSALLATAGSPAAWLGVMLAAACLGFLPWNLPTARLFLGDVGSHALGYAVAALGLMVVGQGNASPWQWLLLPSVFLLDAGITLALRVWRRRKFWLAHRWHLYQRAVSAGWSHVGIAAAYAAWTLCCVLLAISADGLPAVLQLALLLGMAGLGALVYAWSTRRWPLPAPVTEFQR
ncbi:MraY family glycosyltransferase [Arenimonas sp. MALMAid1274]|uniref:MraY family glycosyltransferase n=1 Tax=Arenimonas sp. MALMAid1274 TaxID=3411630 RepID=UPI003BA0EBB3